ncbi:MAG: hypothetical protein AABZ14_06095 [Candidatus Margulisiibacteriota bacterium]
MLLRILFIGYILVLSLSDNFPVTLNLKDHQIVLQSNFTWAYIPKEKPQPLVLFKEIPFGTTVTQFQKTFATQKSRMKTWHQEGVYYFDEPFANEPATLFFYFKQDVFYHGEAVFKIISTTNATYMESYARIRSVLSKLYGVPTTSKRTFSEWILGDNVIRLVLTEQNNKLYLGAIFHHNIATKATIAESVSTPTLQTSPTPTSKIMNPSQNVSVSIPVLPDKKKMQLEELKSLIETL